MSRDSLFEQNIDDGIDLMSSALADIDNLVPGPPPAGNAHELGGRPISRSSNEANRLFLNRHGEQFADLSGLSGLASREDARSLAVWDYNRDGLADVAVVNASDPLLEVFRNDLERTPGLSFANSFIAVRLVGGNHTPRASQQWSNRDGVGARIEVHTKGRRIVREQRFGEGLAAQNGAIVLVGIGGGVSEQLRIVWPSGIVQVLADVPAGALITVFENPAESANGEAFAIDPYRVSTAAGRAGADQRPEAVANLKR